MRALLTTFRYIGVLSFLAAPTLAQGGETDWIEVRKLLASDGGGGAQFGASAALDGDRLAVGAPRAAPGDTGAVYVFERHVGGPSRWAEVARLKPLDPVLADLGFAVAIHGDTIVASAPTEGEGAAYVFDWRGDGNWQRTQLLPPDQPDTFGQGIATDGDAVFVGATLDDDAGLNAGAVYVYERDAGGPDSWGPVAKLTATEPLNGAYFGTAASVDEGILVVGARRDSTMVETGGAAHIFERNEGGEWIEVVKLYPSDGEREDFFGEAVAVDGTTVVVGAGNHGIPVLLAGAAYVFERDADGQWLEVAKVVSSDVEVADQFGKTVAISGDRLVGGAHSEDFPGSGSGAAYVFRRDAGGPGLWGEIAKLEASDTHDNQNFGTAVAIDDGTLVGGADGDEEQGGSAGAAYVFRLLDLDLTVTGACPGEISLAITGAAPRAPLGVLWSDAEGATVLPPGGPCEGLELGLENPEVLFRALADQDGELVLARRAPAGVCGRYLQAVEVGICNPSSTAQIP